ncbi:hypothetical protein CCP3SC15_710015 [Gammaproteobacteria bacterium]
MKFAIKPDDQGMARLHRALAAVASLGKVSALTLVRNNARDFAKRAAAATPLAAMWEERGTGELSPSGQPLVWARLKCRDGKYRFLKTTLDNARKHAVEITSRGTVTKAKWQGTKQRVLNRGYAKASWYALLAGLGVQVRKAPADGGGGSTVLGYVSVAKSSNPSLPVFVLTNALPIIDRVEFGTPTSPPRRPRAKALAKVIFAQERYLKRIAQDLAGTFSRGNFKASKAGDYRKLADDLGLAPEES